MTEEEIVRQLKKTDFKLLVAGILLLALLVLIPVKLSFFDNGNRIKIDDVPNFYRVSESLYRSGQPSREGFNEIAEMGIRTVINLRSFHSDSLLIENLDLNYYSIPMTIIEPDEEQKEQLLKIVSDSTRTPVLIHCFNGSDRTGSMVAYYRILNNGWSNEEALTEMTSGGFGYKWFLFGFKRWIRDVQNHEISQK